MKVPIPPALKAVLFAAKEVSAAGAFRRSRLNHAAAEGFEDVPASPAFPLVLENYHRGSGR